MDSVHRSRFGAAAFICVVGGASFALLFSNYYPGMVTADSMDMLCQAVRNQFHDWHSPLMSLIWRYLDKVVPGPPLMLALIQWGYIFGACLLAVELFSNQWLRAACVALLMFWPPLFAALGIVGKDSMFLCISMLFVVSVYCVVTKPSHSILRMTVVVILALLGIAIRIDGAAFLMPELALAYKCVIDPARRSPHAQGCTISPVFQLAIASGAAIATVLLCVGLRPVFDTKVMHATQVFPIQVTLMHDLAGISVAEGQNLMPNYAIKAGIDLALLTERYTPRYVDPLSWAVTRSVPMAKTPVEFAELWAAWRAAVTAHPLEYVSHRIATFAYLLGISHPGPGELYQGHTDLNAAKYCEERRGANLNDPQGFSLYRNNVMPELLNTVVFRGYAYDALGLILISWTAGRIWRSRSRSASEIDQLIISIGIGAGMHQIALIFVSPAAYFRYLTPQVLSCVIMILLLVSRQAHRRASRPAS